MSEKPRLGLVINPIAGIGGKAGLKGRDGIEIQQLAKAKGFDSAAIERTVLALTLLPKGTTVTTISGDMGETAITLAGLKPDVIYSPSFPTTPEDTVLATKALVKAGVDLIVFAGGDGTAGDIYRGLEENAGVPVLGIPCGVKMYSGCFGINPVATGRILANYLSGGLTNFEDREVLDIDEDNIRAGVVEATLQGLVRVPVVRGRTQSRKTAASSAEEQNLASVAEGFIKGMQQGELYILGPGGTTRAIAKKLDIEKTPLGVDVIENGKVISSDCSEAKLLETINGRKAHAVVSIIGGQGFILGRGNQQISPKVVSQLTDPKIIVVATPNKLASLSGNLLIDSGDLATDSSLQGFYKVITGSIDTVVVQAEASN
jgi:predicted polyphosphate/ATP-dependent NAD kinase